ncbi:hypothetical protein HUT19_40465 [Streptomyces sp. NA02950]|uniref:RICIN domain-containing protein n=1 Tax=Streptomyces sp. NA02950 TaxID=2742137 RepID=UPI00159077BF|nr:hypothetical protein [Streptomyces sp. NA02950]QKV97186.1 hypothetical protein HUT19_40465 [Streptomyces sp. NA02950]
MSFIKKAVLVWSAVAALAGALAPAAQAQQTQVLSFYNPAVHGMLDANCSGAGPVTWAPVGGGSCQQWRLVPASQGLLLVNVGNGMCVQAPAQVSENPDMVTCDALDPTEQWLMESVGDQVFIAQASAPHHVLAATQNFDRIEYQEKTGVAQQLWYTTPPV